MTPSRTASTIHVADMQAGPDAAPLKTSTRRSPAPPRPSRKAPSLLPFSRERTDAPCRVQGPAEEQCDGMDSMTKPLPRDGTRHPEPQCMPRFHPPGTRPPNPIPNTGPSNRPPPGGGGPSTPPHRPGCPINPAPQRTVPRPGLQTPNLKQTIPGRRAPRRTNTRIPLIQKVGSRITSACSPRGW